MRIDLPSLGWDDTFAECYVQLTGQDPVDAGELRPARVGQVGLGACMALAADGPLRVSMAGTLLSRAARRPDALPCIGDWVVVRAWPDERLTMEAILPRRTALIDHERIPGDLSGDDRTVAANLDVVAVVEPIHPTPDLERLDRLLNVVGESGAQSVVVLTKADRVADPATIVDRIGTAFAGVRVFATSARTGQGLNPLQPFIGYGQTLALLGRPGSGTSSLVNALVGATVMTARGRGRRALIPLPGGGVVLEAPVRLLPSFEQSSEPVRKIVIRRG